jgi:hydroxymethylpyrimidine/phosphomethylpyrimidine kinase
MAIPVALTIAGSDSGGGAGIQADLKTFTAFGVYGASVLTALTAQNTRGVRAIADVDPAFVAQQLDAVFEDLDIGAAKTGMLARTPVVEAVAERLHAHRVAHLVVDPVMVASSGDILLQENAISALKNALLPLASIVTPNLREAELLTGRKVNNPSEMRKAAKAMLDLGAHAALVKGGHLEGDALDIFYDGREFREFSAPRVPGTNTHGTGCTLSAAIAAGLARGDQMLTAIENAKNYVTLAIQTAPGIGHGAGPINHFANAAKQKWVHR